MGEEHGVYSFYYYFYIVQSRFHGVMRLVNTEFLIGEHGVFELEEHGFLGG